MLVPQVQVSDPEGQNHPLPREIGIGLEMALGFRRQGVHVPLPYPYPVQFPSFPGLGDADEGKPN